MFNEVFKMNKEELEDLNDLLEKEIKTISYALSPKRLFKIEKGKVENLTKHNSDYEVTPKVCPDCNEPYIYADMHYYWTSGGIKCK